MTAHSLPNAERSFLLTSQRELTIADNTFFYVQYSLFSTHCQGKPRVCHGHLLLQPDPRQMPLFGKSVSADCLMLLLDNTLKKKSYTMITEGTATSGQPFWFSFCSKKTVTCRGGGFYFLTLIVSARKLWYFQSFLLYPLVCGWRTW